MPNTKQPKPPKSPNKADFSAAFNAELYAKKASGLLEDIEIAFKANNLHHETTFRQDLCQCDPSVGMSPCPYCIIHNTLQRCKSFIQKTIQ